MFIPNLKCKIRRRKGTNVYGRSEFGRWENGVCGVVRLEELSQSTSVRADSSASRGSAMEDKVKSRILFPRTILLEPGDMVMINGVTLVAQSSWPRWNVIGDLDHYEVDLLILVE